jgi:hypothetical protein
MKHEKNNIYSVVAYRIMRLHPIQVQHAHIKLALVLFFRSNKLAEINQAEVYVRN